jgi:tetratricopeptide (TPR) repeat protein
MPAIALLERAGLECQAAFDDHGATVHYRRAWELARWAFLRGDDAEGEVLSRIGLRLGEAMFWSGDALAVEGVLHEALEHSQADPASQARVYAALGRLAMTRNHSQQARTSLGSAIERAMRAGDPELLAELYVQLAGVLEHDDDLESALRELMEGCMLCTAGGDALSGLEGPPILWRLLLKLAEIHGLRADPQTAIRYGQAALKHAERVGSPVGRARAHELLADLLMVAGRPGPSREHRLQAVEAMRHLGDRRSTAKLLLDLARDDLRSGQADRAKERLHEARHLARAVEWIEGVKRAEIAMS